MKISTSILSSNDRNKCINDLNNTTTDYIHIDAMDNKFVPNYQLPVKEVNKLGKSTKKPFDIHLMVDDNITYIHNLHVDNIKSITFHIETKQNIEKIIKLIKSQNYEVGIAIKPNTDINLIDKYLDKIDKVIIMSVEPGFGGQTFIETSINRIKEIRKKRKDLPIEVDGGINKETINKVKDIVDIAVVGSYITSNNNYQEAINSLKI